MINEYLMVGEAAAYLGVHTDTLRRWDRAGKLEARRYPVNRFRLYLRSDLDKFLRQIGTGASASRSVRTRGKEKRRRHTRP